MSKGFVDGQVYINNQLIPVVPNSINRAKGRGQISVEPQSLGNGDVDTVHSVDISTMKSFFHFSMRSTVENIALIDEWKLNVALNVIRFVGEETTEIYEQMSVVNEVEYPASNDGVITLEFEGNPTVK